MKFFIGVLGLIIFASGAFASSCWVSEQPMTQSINLIGTSEVVNWQKTTYWLNYSGVASTSLKFSVKFDSNSPQRVHMQKFENTPANFSTPFSIVSDSGDLIHGPAVLTVKDDFGKCKFIFKVVRVHKMEIGGPYKIPDLVSNLCIGSSFLTTINTVAGVRVYLYIQHTAAGDLEITLHAPNNGPVVTLSDNNGGLGDNFGAGLGFVNPGYGWTPTVFDDDASTLITSGTPPYSGWYQPQSPLTALVNLSGNQANGTWNICFNDTAAQDDGYFIGAAIELVDQF